MSFLFLYRPSDLDVSYADTHPSKKKRKKLFEITKPPEIEVKIDEKIIEVSKPASKIPTFPYLEALIEDSERQERILDKYLASLKNVKIEPLKTSETLIEEELKIDPFEEDDYFILSTLIQHI